MALYHHKPKVIRRRKGHSSVASAAYCRGINLKDERTGKIHRYSHKIEVVYSEIMLPKDAPAWMAEIAGLEKTHSNKAASLLWNSVEKKEIRKDAQLARIITIALPVELNQEQCIDLTRRYVQVAYCDRGMVADFSIHWENGNPHAHILLSMRFLEENGWGKKERIWNQRSLNLENRKILADMTNRDLKQAGFDITISHLSYAARGIDLEPTIHEGNKNNLANQQARARNKEIRLKNLQKIVDDPEILLDKLSKEKPTFTLEDIANTLGTQLEPANQATLNPSPLPPHTSRQRIASHVKNFLNAAAPQWLQSAPTEPAIAARVTLQEVPGPKIEFSKEASVQQITAEVLAKITQQESVFTERHLASVLSQHVANPTEVVAALLQVKASPQLMAIGCGEDGRERYTTREMFDLENNLQALAEKLNAKASHQVNGRLINRCLKTFKLENDQAKAIRHLLKGNDISVLVGRAGTGKSYSLKAAKAAWEQSGYTVYGVALAGIAAENLERDSGIKSQTIESFACALLDESLSLSAQDIVVMDEAGMTDAISMAKVMAAVWRAEAKLVLVGDHAQLQPIGPGAIFRALLEQTGFAELTTIWRQKETWQKEATTHFAAGRTEKALSFYEEHGHIHLIETAPLAMNDLIESWHQSVQASTLKDNLILAYRNDDVDALNQLARAKIFPSKDLTTYTVQTNKGLLELAIGERILLLKNNWWYQFKNGQRGTITDIALNSDKTVQEIFVRIDGKEEIVSFNPNKYKKFAYGYACTVHRAQGVTVRDAFVFISGCWNKYLSYVAMTRHQQSVQLYGNQEQYKTITKLKKSLSKGALKDSVLDYPLAFAERRGLETETPSNMVRLQKHLSEKLSWMGESLKDNFEQTFFPGRYWENKAKNAAKAQEIQELLQRREDAKLVASYVDANRVVGVAFESLALRKEVLEIDEQTEPKIAAEALQNDPALIALKDALKARNTLSHQIYQEHGKYTAALAIYDISLEKLLKQSQQHAICQNVSHYLHEVSRGRVIYRDKLAALIQGEITAYYPTLLETKVNLKELKGHAQNHLKRQVLRKLSVTARQDFRTVENYVQLTKDTAKLMRQINSSDAALQGSLLLSVDDLTPYEITRLQTLAKTGAPLLRETLIRAQTLNQTRDAVASTIYQDLERYRLGLEFYEIGDTLKFKNLNTQTKAQTWGKERFERLVKQAAQHDKKEQREKLVKEYLNLKQDVYRLAIASTIISDKQSYYSAIFKFTKDPFAILKDLHQDSKAYQRLQLINDFSAEEQQAFFKVEAYVKARNSVGKIWTETQTASNPNHPVLQDIINTHQRLRDELALSIVNNVALYKKALSFFNVQREKLDQNAFCHQIRGSCKEFKERAGNLPLRLTLARKIVANRSAYGIVKEEQGLNWHQLQNYADFAIKQERIAALSPIEQQDYHTVLKYKRLRREAGQLWGALFKQKNAGQELSSELFEKAIALNEKRNELAFSIKGSRVRLDEFLFSGQVYTKDIEKHCAAHEKQVQQQKQRQAFTSLNTTQSEVANHNIDSFAPKQPKVYFDIEAVNQALESRAPLFVESILGLPNQRLSNATTYRYGKKGSLSVTVNGLKVGLWYNFETGEKGNLIGLIQHQYGYDFKHALQHAAEWSGITPESNVSPLRQKPKIERQLYLKDNRLSSEQLQKIEYAKRIALESIPITGTLAERYLKEHRGILGPVFDKNIRFNPSVWESETKQNCPAIVVISRHNKDEIQAVQSIYLNPNTANKMNIAVKKRTHGVQQGASVLVQEAQYIPNIGYKYALAEGPETALSIAQCNKDLGVYATLSVSNFSNTPIPIGTKDILICADNDGINAPSHKALNKAIDSLAERGLNVYITQPIDYKDFNDVLMKQGENEAKRLVDDKRLVKLALTLEQLIENKDVLVSDNAKIIVDFETKYREYENLREPKTLEEVQTRTELLEQIEKLAFFISEDQGILKEFSKRHQIDHRVHRINNESQKQKMIQEEVKKLMQKINSSNHIEDYLITKEQKSKIPAPWMSPSESEKLEWRKLNDRQDMLAFIIDNTPELQYRAKQEGISAAIKRDSHLFLEKIKQSLNLSQGIGLSR